MRVGYNEGGEIMGECIYPMLYYGGHNSPVSRVDKSSKWGPLQTPPVGIHPDGARHTALQLPRDTWLPSRHAAKNGVDYYHIRLVIKV